MPYTESSARRYNARLAPDLLPVGGLMDYPGLYHQDKGSAAYAQEVRRFQVRSGIAADGMLGPVTYAAFDAQYGAEPAHPQVPCAPSAFDLQVWVAWARLDAAELRWLKSLGVTTLIFNLNKAEGPSKWFWDGRREDIARNMREAKQAGFRTIAMVWMYREHAFCLDASERTLRLCYEVGADGVQFDVEGHWVHRGTGGRLGDDDKVQRWWRPSWAGQGDLEYSASPLYFRRGAVDALLDEPEIQAIYPQAYSPWLPGKPDTHASWFRAPSLQRKALANYRPFGKRIIMGIGGWQQRAPGGPSPQIAMMTAAEAAYQGGAAGLCLWGLHTIQPGVGRGWPEEAAHRAGWEAICRAYGGRQVEGAACDESESEPATAWHVALDDPYAPPIPQGFGKVGKPIPRGVVEAARRVRAQDNPLGTYTPLLIDGVRYVAVDCKHTHQWRPGGAVRIPGGIHGVTVYREVG